MSLKTLAPGDRIETALYFASSYGSIDGDHHKMWVIDQMVRALTGCPVQTKRGISNGRPWSFEFLGTSPEYQEWVTQQRAGEDGPETYDWSEGIAP